MIRKIFLAFLLSAGLFVANGQRLYFIYLQTDTGEPFFATLNEKLSNSTASGYLVLSKLKDSSYHFKIGFPGKDAELDFTVLVNGRDHGYLIKNFGEKGWGIYDLQSLSIQMSNTKTANNSQATGSMVQVSAFTELLSRAVDDPSLKQASYLEPEEKTKAVVQTTANEKTEKNDEKSKAIAENTANEKKEMKPVEKPDTNSAIPVVTETKQPEVKAIVPPKEPPYQRSSVTRVGGSTVSDGVEMVYVDQMTTGATDTIRIILPQENKALDTPKTEVKEDKKFLDIIADSSSVQPPVKENIAPVPDVRVQAPMTNNCLALANDNDFLKLRRKMAEKTNDDGMLDEAKKYFKVKCFTTEQVRNLSTMFLSAAGKYHFFDAALLHVSDLSDFPALESEIRDDYYIGRFKAMLRK
jgi:hypothetical protein